MEVGGPPSSSADRPSFPLPARHEREVPIDIRTAGSRSEFLPQRYLLKSAALALAGFTLSNDVPAPRPTHATCIN